MGSLVFFFIPSGAKDTAFQKPSLPFPYTPSDSACCSHGLLPKGAEFSDGSTASWLWPAPNQGQDFPGGVQKGHIMRKVGQGGGSFTEVQTVLPT